MVSKMVLPSEGLPADVAGVGPLICVRPLVDQQVITLGELPVAELADELLLRTGSSTRRSHDPPAQRAGVEVGRGAGRKEGAGRPIRVAGRRRGRSGGGEAEGRGRGRRGRGWGRRPGAAGAREQHRGRRGGVRQLLLLVRHERQQVEAPRWRLPGVGRRGAGGPVQPAGRDHGHERGRLAVVGGHEAADGGEVLVVRSEKSSIAPRGARRWGSHDAVPGGRSWHRQLEGLVARQRGGHDAAPAAATATLAGSADRHCIRYPEKQPNKFTITSNHADYTLIPPSSLVHRTGLFKYIYKSSYLSNYLLITYWVRSKKMWLLPMKLACKGSSTNNAKHATISPPS